MPRERNGKMTDLSNPWQRPPELGTNAFASPGTPVLPVQPEERPRVFQYQPGVNLVSMPRAGFGLANFASLRALAAASKEIRLNIELIKREIRALEWTITDDGGDVINEAVGFFETPDGQHDFDGWLNMLLEEMLVTDAVTIFPDGTLDGTTEAIELVDGTTIRPLLDTRGRIPRPPVPAFLQVLHGRPTGYWDAERLLYKPFNASVASPYGVSPVEFVLMTVNLALRRDVYHIGAFTEGNVPEALVGAPASWGQEQVNAWQEYWDAMVAGNISAQRKMHFVPIEGGKTLPVYEFRKDDINQTAQDEWLMKVACWAFGNSPAEFGLVSGAGLGGAGYAKGQENIQYRSMLRPITQYLARLFNTLLSKYLRYSGAEFKWIGLDPQEDRLKQAQVDQIYIQAGVYTPQYVREREGITGEDDDAAPEVGVEKFFRENDRIWYG